MEQHEICLSCFSPRGGYEVCPYCGFVAGTPNQPAYLLQPGTRLWGRYLIGTVLGIGGFGVTYRAYDTRLATVVAIKEFFPQNLASRIPGETKLRVFSGENFDAYAQQLARFLDEAKNMAKFTGDPHIVNVFDSFEDNGTAYIIMEFLEGETLKEHLANRGGALPPQEAAYIMEGLLAALGVIHKKGILHRDISPDNIYILRDGRVKVLDFGAARFAAKEEWTQSVVVKKGYAPPEQYRSNMKQTTCTDLYAAGATWYKMLTGATPEESIERWEKDRLQRPSALQPGIETGVDKAVMKSMALRPEIRFQSAEAMLAAVRGQTGFDFPEEELKKRRRTQKLSVALAAVLVCVTLGIAAWQFSQSPVVISAGPTLADMNIQPDSITVMMPAYDNEAGQYEALAKAFMEQYPQYSVAIQTLDTENEDRDLFDAAAPDAPTVFTPYWGNARENSADLSLLYGGLNMSEYYMLGQYAQEYTDDLTDVPTEFYMYLGLGSPSGAAAQGVELPKSIESFDELLTLLEAVPGRDSLDIHRFFDLLPWYYPEVYENRGYRPNTVKNEIERCAQILVNSENAGESVFALEGTYQSTLTYAVRRWPQDCTPIPIRKNGRSLGYTASELAVNKNATQNQQYVGMLFLRFLLSEHGQTVLSVQNEGGLPLNKKAMQAFLTANSMMQPFEPEFSNVELKHNYLPYEMTEQCKALLLNNSLTEANKKKFIDTFMNYTS